VVLGLRHDAHVVATVWRERGRRPVAIARSVRGRRTGGRRAPGRARRDERGPRARGRIAMNEMHLPFLPSPERKAMLENDLLPWVCKVADLGDDVLEVGPGPGLTTDLLRERAAKVTAVELDDALAAGLATRLAGSNVDVVHADATATGLPSDHFS